MNTIAERIKSAREACDLTQGQLAQLAGVSQSTIGNIESGTRSRPRNLLAIAAALNVSAEWLESGKTQSSTGNAIPLSTGATPSGSLYGITVPPKVAKLTWEDVMNADELPETFEAPMPDASMEPATPAGTGLQFRLGTQGVPGHGVLVRDAEGVLHVRRYQQGAGGRWIAQATNDAFAPLDSERDGLTIIAKVIGRMTGAM